MAGRLDFNFSHVFSGVIWTTMAVPQKNWLLLEIRNEEKHEVSFAALNFDQNIFLWKDVTFSERWWISLAAATPEVLLLQSYQTMDNPDQKNLWAFHIEKQLVLWTIDNFSFSSVNNGLVFGNFTLDELRPAVLDLMTGKIMDEEFRLNEIFKENFRLFRPFQYAEGTVNFETVQSFLMRKINVRTLKGMEYLEYESLIFISYYIQEEGLANYLMVLTEEGNEVLREKLDNHLKGLGLDTFFILSGCLFFVKNKKELVSYRVI